MSNFDKQKYNNQYNKDNYKQVNFRLNFATYSKLSEQATQNGYTSINAYAKALLEAVLSDELDITGKVGGGRN